MKKKNDMEEKEYWFYCKTKGCDRYCIDLYLPCQKSPVGTGEWICPKCGEKVYFAGIKR